MSGAKKITVDEGEWFRAQRAATKLADIRRDLPELLDSVRDAAAADNRRAVSAFEDRQRRADEAIGRLGEETRSMEKRTNERIEARTTQLRAALDDTAGTLRRETSEQLAAHQRQWRSELADERRERRAELSRIEREIGAVTRDLARTAQRAGAWIADARTLHDLIRDTLPHDRWAPGRLPALSARLDTAADNLTRGSGDAALAVAQETYHELGDLRLELELRDREWTLARAGATDALRIVDGLIDQQARPAVLDAAGEPMTGLVVEVDHWSAGGLTALRADVAAALGEVGDDTVPVDLDRLRRVVELEAPGFEQRLVDVVDQARLRQMASQMRVNLADIVVQTLDGVAGYELVDGTYAGEDQRAAFVAKLRHQNGNEIVVDVSPGGDDSGGAVLRVLSYDQDVSGEEDRLARARAVVEGLRAQGVEAGEAVPEQGEPDRALLDLDAVRKATVAATAPAPPPVSAPRRG